MSRHFKVAPFGLDAEAKALGKIFADCPHLLNRYFGPFPQKGLAERGQIFMGFSAGPGLQNRPEEKKSKASTWARNGYFTGHTKHWKFGAKSIYRNQFGISSG